MNNQKRKTLIQAKKFGKTFRFIDDLTAINDGGEINPLSVNFTKWSNTPKQLVGNLPTNCLSVFDHFVGLALKGLKKCIMKFTLMSQN